MPQSYAVTSVSPELVDRRVVNHDFDDRSVFLVLMDNENVFMEKALKPDEVAKLGHQIQTENEVERAINISTS